MVNIEWGSEHALAFADKNGFKVEIISNDHLADTLSCIDILGLDRQKVRDHLSSSRVFAMTLK